MNQQQQQALKKGSLAYETLVDRVNDAVLTPLDNTYPHTYIYSPAGIGKTEAVNRAIEAHGLDNNSFVISGRISTWMFAVKLAVIRHLIPEDETIYIVVDDCDTIFKSLDDINLFKNVLEGERAFTYEVDLSSRMKSLTDVQLQAISRFATDQNTGFTIPCDNVIFIFTSNFKLPTRFDRATPRNEALAAIRSRCETFDLDMDFHTLWGWIAHITYTSNLIEATDDEKALILDYIWNNHSRMKEISLRTIIKMHQKMITRSTDYVDYWNVAYLEF